MFHVMQQTPTERTAAAIRAEIARRRISAKDLAQNLGVSRTTLWRRLNGHAAIDVDELTRMAAVIGVPISALLSDRDAA